MIQLSGLLWWIVLNGVFVSVTVMEKEGASGAFWNISGFWRFLKRELIIALITLYIPMLVMFVGVLSDRRFLSRVLLGALFAALLFSCLSVFRAHKKNLFRHPMDVLRAKDKELVLMSKSVDRGTPVEIDFVDAAFADFAVDVRNPGSIFVFTR